MTNVVLPYGLSFNDWANQVYNQFPSDYLPIPPTEDTSWQDWAAYVVSTKSFSKVSAPSPYNFDNWRDWAARIVELF